MLKKFASNKLFGLVLFFGLTVVVSISFFKVAQFIITNQQKPDTFIGSVSSKKISSPTDQTLSQLNIPTSQINWQEISFDDCGAKPKYDTLAWWDKFSASVNLFGIREQNRTNGPISIEEFSPYGEGCLSTNGEAFIAVFGGIYGGESNYVIRYDIANDVLEAAAKIKTKTPHAFSWFAPPVSFGKRDGAIIKMYGDSGDAGCVVNTEFEYNYVTNEVRVIKECSKCEDSIRPICTVFTE